MKSFLQPFAALIFMQNHACLQQTLLYIKDVMCLNFAYTLIIGHKISNMVSIPNNTALAEGIAANTVFI